MGCFLVFMIVKVILIKRQSYIERRRDRCLTCWFTPKMAMTATVEQI